MKKTKHISVVLEEDTYIRLQALAAEDKRAVSNLARYVIKLYICDVDSGKTKLSIYRMFK